jgi:hypothetical protein
MEVFLRRWCHECYKAYPVIFNFLKTKRGMIRSVSRKNDKCDKGHDCILQYRRLGDPVGSWQASR